MLDRKPHPDQLLSSVVADWRPGDRIEFSWGGGSAFYRALTAAVITGLIVATPGTRSGDWLGAAILFPIGFILAFPIALLFFRGLNPSGGAIIEFGSGRLILDSGGRVFDHATKAIDRIAVENSDTTPVQVALVADLGETKACLLHSANISAAGGHLLPEETERFEAVANELAKSLRVPYERRPLTLDRPGFLEIIRSNPLWVQLAALGSVALICYIFFTALPALPVLSICLVSGVLVRHRLGDWVRWFGMLAAIIGIVILFTTVGLYAEHVETPWDTPAPLRWGAGFLIFFGAGLFGMGTKSDS